jgi:hypothetical protein
VAELFLPVQEVKLMDDSVKSVYAFFKSRGFLPVDTGAYAVLKKYEYDILVQELGAVPNVIWATALNIHYKIIRSCLCSVYYFEGFPVFFEIHRSGPMPPDALKELIGELYDLSQGAGLPFLQIRSVEERMLPLYQLIEGYKIDTEYSEDGCEYAYRTVDILELSGGKNLNKRNALNKFFPMTTILNRPLTKKNIHRCLEIEGEWCRDRDCGVCASFTGCEKEALETMVKLFDEGVHQGLLVFIGDKPAAYAIWERRGTKVAFIYFAKTTVPNFGIYLYYTMVKECLSGIEYINVNEDMGKASLRFFKRRLSAYELWPKYVCTYRRNSDVR